MKSQDFFALQDAYKVMYAEAKDESPEKEEEDRKKDDDLFGSPNKKKNGKKADKDYDGDGKVESSKDEYFGSKDKAIKKAMGKDVKESRWWDIDINEAMVVTNADKKANTPAYQNYKKGLKKKDGTPMYKAADHMKEGYGKKKKKHDCASKVKHEEYGVGNCIAEMHDLDENGNVAHYDVLFEHGVEKNVPVETLQILEGHMHEHYIAEKQKDTPDQVKAVIAYDKARKATDDATYDSIHGDKKQAKKEKDYAKWQRDKGAEDAQKSGHPWEHAKGSTREKEGKKSEKHAHIKDSFDPQREEQLWDEIAAHLTEIHERGGVKFKVVPFDANEEKNWIQGAVKRPGAFTKKAKAAGMSVQQFAKHVDANKDKYSTRTERQANLAQTFSKMKKEGADYDALSSFLVQEGADDQAVNYILANWVEDDRLGKIEEGEKLAQKAYKRAQELGAKRRRSGDPSGIYKSERAGYNLAQSQRSDNESPATQRGPQTGGGPKDFGFARHKKNPVKSKSVGDTGRIGHAKKAQEKTSVGKSGKKLKTPKYKLSFQQRRDHHSDWSKRQELKDPKKNPKHTANK